jgi:hypothetical protein
MHGYRAMVAKFSPSTKWDETPSGRPSTDTNPEGRCTSAFTYQQEEQGRSMPGKCMGSSAAQAQGPPKAGQCMRH